MRPSRTSAAASAKGVSTTVPPTKKVRMADLSRYEMIAGSVIVCNDCHNGEHREVVHAFKGTSFSVEDMRTEIEVHEWDRHEPVFENNATANAGAALRSSQALSERADRVAREVRDDEYYACYADETAYRDGMVNGMGGAAGDMASLLGPQAEHHPDRTSTRLNSSHVKISYAVFCLEK